MHRTKEGKIMQFIHNKRANILKNSYYVKCNYNKYLKTNLKDEDLVSFFTLHIILWMNGGTAASKLICLLF